MQNREQLESEGISQHTKPFDPNLITIEEIFATRDALLELGLSTELAALILNYAEYWCQQHFSCTVPLRISVALSRNRPERFYTKRINSVLKEASCLYLQTSPIGYGGEFDNLPMATPKQVSFRVISRDEKDHMEMGRIGTFLNHVSWLDASIIREDESWAGAREEPISVIASSAPGDVVQYTDPSAQDQWLAWYVGDDPFNLPSWLSRDNDRTKIEGGFKFVPHSERLMWLLQRNRVFGVDLVEKQIVWKDYVSEDYKVIGEKWWTDDCDRKIWDGTNIDQDFGPPIETTHGTYWQNGVNENDEEAKEEEWPVDGTGSGRNFINSLLRGDRIGVWARAMVGLLYSKLFTYY
jgi:hypothetical protein